MHQGTHHGCTHDRAMSRSLPEVRVSEDGLAESGWRAFHQRGILVATLSIPTMVRFWMNCDCPLRMETLYSTPCKCAAKSTKGRLCPHYVCPRLGWFILFAPMYRKVIFAHVTSFSFSCHSVLCIATFVLVVALVLLLDRDHDCLQRL
jgi:hypothetical protein